MSKKPTVFETWKVADISGDEISPVTRKYVLNFAPKAYEGEILHLYDPEAILATSDTDYEATPEDIIIRHELEVIQKVIGKKGCHYFRIV